MAKQTFTTGQVLSAAQMTSLQQTAMGGGSTTAKTASYVLVAADAGTVVQMNSASATTITVNTALFAAGDSVQIQNIGAGVCTVTAGTATVSTAGSLALSQYEGGQLYFNTTSAALFFDIVQSASGGADPYLTNKSTGRYIRAKLANAGIGTNTVGTLAQTCFTPIYVPACTVDRIAITTQTVAALANKTCRLGIYNNTNGAPSTVLLDAGTVSATASNTVYEITISQALTAGWYWLAANMQTVVVAGDVEFLTTNSSTAKPQFFASNASFSFGSDNSGWLQASVTGAFGTASPTATNNELILVALRLV